MAAPAPGSARPPLRETARIVLADERDRILLFRYVDDRGDGPYAWWGTPGGAVAEGETPAEAAARELYEETGLRVPAAGFGRAVAFSEGRVRFAGKEYWFVNRYFFRRTASFEPDDTRWEERERSMIAGHRWWSAADLSATADRVYPPGIAALLPDLLAGRLPAEPVDVGG